jgi:exonuclease III
MRIVSWNCKGLGNPSKDEAVKYLLKIDPPEILLLQETKIEGDTLLEINNQKWKKNAGKAISARGSSGGLATLWVKEIFYLESSFETQHWIFTEIRHIPSKIYLSLFNLYVPVRYSEKKDCWQPLADFLEIFSPSNIILARDLNLIFKPKEKRGGNSIRDDMLPFVEEFVHQWDLLDFKHLKGLYNWTNNRVGVDHISARLDRFLIQSRFLQERRIISSKILPKLTSEHKPVLLILEE